jgi:flagellar biosynthesis protein FlhG
MMSAAKERSARVIAITSGKGGVGKTNVSVNLSVALGRIGKQAMLVDGDFGLANANILLGLNATATIADLLSRNCAMADVIQEGPAGMKLVPGHSGSGAHSALGTSERRQLASAFRPYAGEVDHVLVDTASGIGPEAMSLVASSDVILLVLSGEPTAFMDAYQLVKVLAMEHSRTEILVVTNMVDDEEAGHQLFRHFDEVVKRFLPTRLAHLGSVPLDDRIRESVLRKRCCLEAFPESRASAAFGRLAQTLSDVSLPQTDGGDRFFGMEALHAAH